MFCSHPGIVFPGEFDAYDDADNVQTMSKVLEMKIPILMAYGMKDATCNYVGALLMDGLFPCDRPHEPNELSPDGTGEQ